MYTLSIVLRRESVGGEGARYIKGDQYRLVEMVGFADQENEKGWGFSTPKGAYQVYGHGSRM